jgi:hypothetical protein
MICSRRTKLVIAAQYPVCESKRNSSLVAEASLPDFVAHSFLAPPCIYLVMRYSDKDPLVHELVHDSFPLCIVPFIPSLAGLVGAETKFVQLSSSVICNLICSMSRPWRFFIEFLQIVTARFLDSCWSVS